MLGFGSIWVTLRGWIAFRDQSHGREREDNDLRALRFRNLVFAVMLAVLLLVLHSFSVFAVSYPKGTAW